MLAILAFFHCQRMGVSMVIGHLLHAPEQIHSFLQGHWWCLIKSHPDHLILTSHVTLTPKSDELISEVVVSNEMLPLTQSVAEGLGE